MSEEVAQALGSLEYWQRRAEQAEANAADTAQRLIDWIDADGTMAFADEDEALAEFARTLRTRPHPGASLLAERDDLRAALECLLDGPTDAAKTRARAALLLAAKVRRSRGL